MEEMQNWVRQSKRVGRKPTEFLEAVVKPTKMNLEEGEDMRSTEGSREGSDTAEYASDVLAKGRCSGFCRKNLQRKTEMKDKLLEGPSR
jgi:hypothetical protein